MAAIIDFPHQNQAMAAVIQSLEDALALAKKGELSGIALTFVSSRQHIHECVEAADAESAVMLLGQASMVVDDLRKLTRNFRQSHAAQSHESPP